MRVRAADLREGEVLSPISSDASITSSFEEPSMHQLVASPKRSGRMAVQHPPVEGGDALLLLAKQNEKRGGEDGGGGGGGGKTEGRWLIESEEGGG